VLAHAKVSGRKVIDIVAVPALFIIYNKHGFFKGELENDIDPFRPFK
jgi:hypothetical protein